MRVDEVKCYRNCKKIESVIHFIHVHHSFKRMSGRYPTMTYDETSKYSPGILRASPRKNVQFFVTNLKMNFLPAAPMPILDTCNNN